MEPAVKAVIAQNPQLDTGNIDVFACTSTVGSLIRFLKNDDRSFRFTVEAVGRTVFFVRRENAPDELIAGPRGYGSTGHGSLISLLFILSVPWLILLQVTHSLNGTRAGRRKSKAPLRTSASFLINLAA